jgi:hypothetical protein
MADRWIWWGKGAHGAHLSGKGCQSGGKRVYLSSEIAPQIEKLAGVGFGVLREGDVI